MVAQKTTKDNSPMRQRIVKYKIIIQWSAEDRAFIAEMPKLPGCMAHGTTQEEALHNLRETAALWIEAAQGLGRDIPKPDAVRAAA